MLNESNLIRDKLIHKNWPTCSIEFFNTRSILHDFYCFLLQLTNYSELARHVYYGGVRAKHLRPLVWLYLLGYYHPESNEDDRRKIDEESKLHYSRIRMVDNEIKLVSDDVIVTSTLFLPKILLEVTISFCRDISTKYQLQMTLLCHQRMAFRHQRQVQNTRQE